MPEMNSRFDDHVDGNAIGGLLIEVFGREMTDAAGCCDGCGAVAVFAELVVYRSGPGDVICCPRCGAVLVVATPRASGSRIHFSGLRWLQPR